MVDFNLVMELAYELEDKNPIHSVIEYMAMGDIPMSDAVIKLGIACGILEEDYKNGWSEEEAV